MTNPPRTQSFDQLYRPTHRRYENLATGAHPTRLQDGGFGRNRDWAIMGIGGGAKMTDDGYMRWCIVADLLIIETVDGLLDLTDLQEPMRPWVRPKPIAQLHPHGWPAFPHVFRTTPTFEGSWRGPTLLLLPNGQLVQYRTAPAGDHHAVAVHEVIPLG